METHKEYVRPTEDGTKPSMVFVLLVVESVRSVESVSETFTNIPRSGEGRVIPCQILRSHFGSCKSPSYDFRRC